MAYPTVSTPYGLVPVNRIDGMPYAGAIRQIPAISGNALICFGDAVNLTAAGGVDKMSDGTAGTPCGVSVGCQYVNSQGQTVQSQFLPASTAGTVYVVDDPMALFKVAVVSGTTVVSTTGLARTVVGNNAALVINTGSTTTGNSLSGLLASSVDTTSSLPVRVIDVVPQTQLASGNYVELLVKLNTHQYNNTTGV
jgi:hypothetical protein